MFALSQGFIVLHYFISVYPPKLFWIMDNRISRLLLPGPD